MTLMQTVKMFAVTRMTEATLDLQQLEREFIANGGHTAQTVSQHGALLGQVRTLGDLALLIAEQERADAEEVDPVSLTEEDEANLKMAWEQVFGKFFADYAAQAAAMAESMAPLIEMLSAMLDEDNENATPGG